MAPRPLQAEHRRGDLDGELLDDAERGIEAAVFQARFYLVPDGLVARGGEELVALPGERRRPPVGIGAGREIQRANQPRLREQLHMVGDLRG